MTSFSSGNQGTGPTRITPMRPFAAPVPRPAPIAVRRPVQVFPTTAQKTPPPVMPSAKGSPIYPVLSQASYLATTNPRDLTASGTAVPESAGGGVSPSFTVAGGSATTTGGTSATGSDYTWLLYVAAGVGLLLVTLYRRK